MLKTGSLKVYWVGREGTAEQGKELVVREPPSAKDKWL